MFRCLALLAAILLGAFCMAQFSGEGQYPEFRSFSGLPGGGFPVSPTGVVGCDGALAYSTPVAYSLAPWRMALGTGIASKNAHASAPQWDSDDWNFTAFGMMGVGLPFGRLTVGGMILSKAGNSVATALFSPRESLGRFDFAVGVQDVKGKGGAAGEHQPGDKDSSSSPFVVSTASLGRGVYASAGVGLRRYGKGFANVSAPLSRRVRATLEHDGFVFNAGAYVDAGGFAVSGKRVNVGAFGGLVQMRYPCVGVTISF